MSESRNRYIVMRYFSEIMTEGNLGSLYELLAPDFVFTLPTHPEPYVGPDGFKELVTMLHLAFRMSVVPFGPPSGQVVGL